MRWVKRVVVILCIGVIAILLASNSWVILSTQSRVYKNTDSISHYPVALVLGTSYRTKSGKPNPFFENRISMAAELYKSGKVRHFLLSGDNRSKYYNEPSEMRKALIKAGVPAAAITRDFAGFRTLDSIVRSKEIFGQNKIAIITQPFHSYRALFIADYYHIEAIAMVAPDSRLRATVMVNIREFFARPMAIIDLYFLKTEPHHLGPKETLPATI
jgi:SanA protein